MSKPRKLGFYELEEVDRLQLLADATDGQSSLIYRWENLGNKESDVWSNRAYEAAKLTGEVKSVVDVGCGMMTLERFLNPHVDYIPVDIVSRDERTYVVDINRSKLPVFDAECVAALGLLEYIYDVDKFMDSVARYGRVVLSYNL